MFYDDLTRKLTEEINQQESRLEEICLKIEIPESEKKLCYDEFVRSDLGASVLLGLISRKSMVNSLGESKVFLIDEMTQDSLQNVKHENINYALSVKLPFPQIFFQFNSPVSFKLMSGKTIDTFGALYTTASDLNTGAVNIARDYLSNITDKENIPLTRYCISFFNKEPSFVKQETGVVDLTFDISTLPNFRFQAERRLYDIDYRNNKILRSNLETLEGSLEWEKEDVTGIVDKNVLSEGKKKIDLALNLISYINAQNVVVLKKDRETHSPKDLARINRKRMNDGKKPIAPLKPYYLIEVKKSYVNEEEEQERSASWNLKYRVWVRGHPRHYQDGKCIWIKEYVKGPPEAPWKHNRYEVLYKNFKNILENKITS
ncbi:MAG: hypothetical protein NTX01_02915 [Candidatus Omnitrophica bacterium]|nr:hypothetical protein [Candidatus Omnitrophota bacterium]